MRAFYVLWLVAAIKYFFMGRVSRERQARRVERLKVTDGVEEQHQGAEEEVITRRRLLFGGAAVVAASAIGAILLSKDDEAEKDQAPKLGDIKPTVENQEIVGLPRNNFTKVRSAVLPTTDDEFEKAIALQEHWKGITEEALGKFVNADPKVQVLINFMHERAYYSLSMGPRATQTIFSKNDQRDFKEILQTGFRIVYMPDKYASSMLSPVMTQDNGRTMRIATTFKCEEWLGIMLAHEMSHVYDGMVEVANYNNLDEHLAGEVKAHLFEMKLLKYWNEEAYARLIKEGIPLWRARRSKDVFKLCKSLYPLSSDLVSPNESGLGMASCVTAIAFEMAMQDGLQEKDLGRVYSSLKQSFAGSGR